MYILFDFQAILHGVLYSQILMDETETLLLYYHHGTGIGYLHNARGGKSALSTVYSFRKR